MRDCLQLGDLAVLWWNFHNPENVFITKWLLFQNNLNANAEKIFNVDQFYNIPENKMFLDYENEGL